MYSVMLVAKLAEWYSIGFVGPTARVAGSNPTSGAAF